MQEFGSNYESEMLRHPKKLALADVLIFVYDSSDTNSFSYISNLRVSLGLAHMLDSSSLGATLILPFFPPTPSSAHFCCAPYSNNTS